MSNSYFWIKISKLYKYPILVCCTYIPPASSNYFDKNVFVDIENDILDYQVYDENYVLLLGDFNARTGLLSDLQQDGDIYSDTSYLNSNISRARKNFDGCINSSGQKLISLCKGNNLHILNGRKEGDSLGKFTFENVKGESSTVDYGIASYDLFDKISNFTVRPESYLSDHCQIANWLNIGAHKQKHDDSWKDNLYKLPNLFKFKCQNKASFLKALGTKDIQLKIRNFIDHQYLLTEKGLQDANKDFSDIIISAAKNVSLHH